jgi:prophage tail gpP-like protein
VYEVTEDGDLDKVAGEVYGNPSKSAVLQWSNPAYGTTGASRVGNGVKKGEQLIIPGNPPPLRLTGKQPDDLTVLIGGLDIPQMSARIIRTMDTGTDGWTGRIAWVPGVDAGVDRVTRPFGYERAAAYIGNELLVAGCLYMTEPEMTERGMTKGLHGFSFTADAIDSHVQPPYEYNNVSLKQLADALTPPLGIKAVFTDEVLADAQIAFPRVTSHERDSIFTFLAKLATQRGILVSSTPQGDLFFLRANTEGKPVGTLQEKEPMVVGWKARYDGRKRFYAYKCITSGAKQGAVLQWDNPGHGAPSGKAGPSLVISYDKTIPRSRFITFHADDTVPGNIHNAARWKRNKQFVEALTHEFPVTDWYAPNGKLWEPNTLVTVISPTLGVPDGYNFLIRQIEFILDDKRRTAMLSLVPPNAYSEKDIGLVWT